MDYHVVAIHHWEIDKFYDVRTESALVKDVLNKLFTMALADEG